MIVASLARELKYNGFPQQIDPGCKIVPEPNMILDLKNPSTYAKVPTLDELMNACGPEFRGITRQKGKFTAEGLKNKQTITAEGISAETAVANLWLKLSPIDIKIDPKTRNLILKILEETKLSKADVKLEQLVETKGMFKGWNMAVARQEILIMEVLTKYLCVLQESTTASVEE